MRSYLITAALVVGLAGPAEAQFGFRKSPAGPPEGLTPAEAEIWPYPAPDPNSWWEDDRLKPTEAADPLGGRRLRRDQQLPRIDNRIEASTYRLWGLTPLQWQVLKGDEMVLEIWVRPSTNVRQRIVRITVRDDGDTFVQGRAGLACCEALIGRRMGFDAELPAGSGRRFQALGDDPVWNEPRDVRIDQGGGLSEGVCVDGVSYDLTILTRKGAKVIRRACDGAEVGQAADVIEPVLRAALGHDPRFDVLFPRGADFSRERRDYQALLARGGSLRAQPVARTPAPGDEPKPPS